MRQRGGVGGGMSYVAARLDVWADEVEAFEAAKAAEEVALFVRDFVKAHRFK